MEIRYTNQVQKRQRQTFIVPGGSKSVASVTEEQGDQKPLIVTMPQEVKLALQ